MFFNFVISKEASFFSWLKSFEPKTASDEELLAKVKYFLTSDAVVNVFDILILEKENAVWQTLAELVGLEKSGQVREIAASLEKKFLGVWPEGQEKMKALSVYYQNNQNLFISVIRDINRLCGVADFKVSSVPIHLVLTSRKDLSGWFSWAPSKSDVVLECPRSGVENNKFPLAVLSHEFFHLILRKNEGLIKEMREFVSKHGGLIEKFDYGVNNPEMVFEELVVSSFIPEGYLAEKKLDMEIEGGGDATFHTCRNILDFSHIRKTCAVYMYGTAKRYVEEDQSLNGDYFEFLREALQKILEKSKKKKEGSFQ